MSDCGFCGFCGVFIFFYDLSVFGYSLTQFVSLIPFYLKYTTIYKTIYIHITIYKYNSVLYHQGFHALVCYRLGHRLWQAKRTGLAYYMQSTVSRKYSADIHPAARLGKAIHLRATAGVVIGETAVIGDDVSILEGVTLGGTGKESGDRHPKLANGVLVEHAASILGNIQVGEGSIISSRSIVTKPVPPLAIMSGVPAKVIGYRQLTPEEFECDLQAHLVEKYRTRWQQILKNMEMDTALEI